MLSSGLQGLRIFQQMEKNVYGLTRQRALIKKWIVHMQVKTILIVWKVAEDFLHGKTNATISRPWKFARQIGCTWRKVQCKRGQKVWPTPGTWRCLITASLQRPCLLTTNVLTRSPNWRHKGSASWRKKTKRHVAYCKKYWEKEFGQTVF